MRYSISITMGPLRAVSERRTSGSARGSSACWFGPLTSGIRIQNPSNDEDTKATPEIRSAPFTPMALAVLPQISASERNPTGDRGLIGGQRATGNPSGRGKLNADIEQGYGRAVHPAPANSSAPAKSSLLASRSSSDDHYPRAHHDHAHADRIFIAQTVTQRRDIERADHRAHAKSAQHETVDLGPSMQEFAR